MGNMEHSAVWLNRVGWPSQSTGAGREANCSPIVKQNGSQGNREPWIMTQGAPRRIAGGRYVAAGLKPAMGSWGSSGRPKRLGGLIVVGVEIRRVPIFRLQRREPILGAGLVAARFMPPVRPGSLEGAAWAWTAWMDGATHRLADSALERHASWVRATGPLHHQSMRRESFC